MNPTLLLPHHIITSYFDCSVEPLWCGLSLSCWSLVTVLFGEGAKLCSFYPLVPLCWEGAASSCKKAVTCDKGGRYWLEECRCLYSDIAGCFRGISCGCCPLVWLLLPLVWSRWSAEQFLMCWGKLQLHFCYLIGCTLVCCHLICHRVRVSLLGFWVPFVLTVVAWKFSQSVAIDL